LKGAGASVFMNRGKRESLGEEECLQPRHKNCNRVAMENSLW